MCIPCSPLCSRLVILNYILAQKLEEQTRLGQRRQRLPVVERCAAIDSLVKPARSAIVVAVQPLAAKTGVQSGEDLCQPPP